MNSADKQIQALSKDGTDPGYDLGAGGSPSGEVGLALGIGAVERDTGLSKDVLRIWERRYRFPVPFRDRFGERAYPQEQVAKLRLIKRLMDRGFRPGRVVPMQMADLESLASTTTIRTFHSETIEHVLQLIRQHQLPALRQHLNQLLLRQGLQRFINETVSPLTTAVGEAWSRGEIAVFEEHLYTEQVQSILRNAISSVHGVARNPRVLLTSLPNELHSLGLLMVEALLALDGATCISLGTETPAEEISGAAQAHGIHIVALSFSAAFPDRQAASSLDELRASLPKRMDLWAGGSGVRRIRRVIEGVSLVRSLDQIGPLLHDWRVQHGQH